MFQAKVLDGKQAGAVMEIREFPFAIGRAPAHLALYDPGIWERHLELDLTSAKTLVARARAQALASKNGTSFSETTLRNGDVLQLSSVRIQITLGNTVQRSLRPREILTWTGLAAAALCQIWVIYWLSQLL